MSDAHDKTVKLLREAGSPTRLGPKIGATDALKSVRKVQTPNVFKNYQNKNPIKRSGVRQYASSRPMIGDITIGGSSSRHVQGNAYNATGKVVEDSFAALTPSELFAKVE